MENLTKELNENLVLYDHNELLGECKLSVGFFSFYPSEVRENKFIEMVSEPGVQIYNIGNMMKPKIHFYLRNVRLEIRKVKHIRKVNHSERIIELTLKSTFSCLDLNNHYTENKLVNFDHQLLRYWVLKPIFRLEFRDKAEADKIVEFLGNNFRKRKRVDERIQKKFMGDTVTPVENVLNYNSISIHLVTLQHLFIEKLRQLPDCIQYQIFVLISSGKLIRPVDIPNDFIEFLTFKKSSNKNANKQLVNALSSITGEKNIENTKLLKLFFYIYEGKRFISCYNYDPKRVLIKKVFITPNLIKFKNKNCEETNRVLNNYKGKEEDFIRCSFSDDKEGRDFYIFEYKKGLVNGYFKKFYEEGLKVVDKKYSFVGCSNSQMRSHSFWMYISSIDLNEYGDFSRERNISKHVSRKNLLFTTAKLYKPIAKEDILLIEDVFGMLKDEHDFSPQAQKGMCMYRKYIFTDGIGLIAEDLAIDISKSMFEVDYCSAFQVRIAGVKGVLVVCKDLPKGKIGIRPSMKKFESDLNDLYIIRPSKLSVGLLNRQIITLLEYLGVDKQIFLNLQEKYIKKLDSILNLECCEDDLVNIKGTMFSKLLIKDCVKICLEKGGASDYKKEPFIQGMLNTICINKMENLKNKADIPVEKSARLMGVSDNLNILEENQIYVQIQSETVKRQVITGRVIVTKNPCMYPGDVIVCEAVDDERLSYLVNVVVFPQNPDKTMRPLQQLCNDGDLDGDVYFVCWDHSLIPDDLYFGKWPGISYYEELFQISIGKKPKETSLVESEHIINFNCEFMTKDILGILCRRYEALSDKYSPEDAQCLRLSCYQSSAVNFGKYDETISLSELNEFKVEEYPHFMEKDPNRTYTSHKALGDLYTHVKQIYQDYSKKSQEDNDYVCNKLFKPGFEIFIHIINSCIYGYYCEYLLHNIEKYDLNNEFEFLSGVLIKFKNNKFGHDHFEVTIQIKDDCNLLINQFKTYFNIININFCKIILEQYKWDIQDYEKFIKKFDGRAIKEIVKELNRILEKYDFDEPDDKHKYEEYISGEVKKLQNDPFYTKVREGLLSACVYCSYQDLIKPYLIGVKNHPVFQEVKKIFRSYSVQDNSLFYEDEVYFQLSDVRGDNNEIVKIKENFRSLPWILDHNFMLRNLKK